VKERSFARVPLATSYSRSASSVFLLMHLSIVPGITKRADAYGEWHKSRCFNNIDNFPPSGESYMRGCHRTGERHIDIFYL